MTNAAAPAIEAKASALGFDAVGFARPDPGIEAKNGLRQYLAEGRHGSMGWMQDRADWRMDPLQMMPTAKSIVMLGMSYAPVTNPLDERNAARVSVFARGRDYHDVMKKRLKALARWMAEEFQAGVKLFADTAPLMEKPLAARAGLGWQGKHTNLVSRTHGSWLFLGSVLTDLDLPASQPEADHCGSCSRCIEACPTGAITPYRMDARRCISYLTIETKHEVPPDLARLLGNRVFGCDDCLAVCPWNKFASPSPHHEFAPRFEPPGKIDDWRGLDEESWRKLFAQTPVKRAGFGRFMNRLAIAADNAGDQHGR
ncbi:MAG: tRNA epoxyqueuosine(34) reductase QueG [Rhodospirillales bacterium]|nr:tRNA epoxyqueuosine(34) reductase QueG [Rhodospirillales bacterium]